MEHLLRLDGKKTYRFQDGRPGLCLDFVNRVLRGVANSPKYISVKIVEVKKTEPHNLTWLYLYFQFSFSSVKGDDLCTTAVCEAAINALIGEFGCRNNTRYFNLTITPVYSFTPERIESCV